MQLSINELDSAIITHAKSQQAPSKFVAKDSGINMADYAKNHDKPGAMFQVASLSRSPMTTATLPNLPNGIENMSSILTARIQQSTGSSDIAQGQGSGSLQTSGGVSQILQRATLKDTKVVNQIRKFYLHLYKLMMQHVALKHGLVRYAAKDHVENEVQYKILDLSTID